MAANEFPHNARKKDYLFTPRHKFPLDPDDYLDDRGRCYLVALDDKQIKLVLNALTLMRYYSMWGWTGKTIDKTKWDGIDAFISEMEVCLMDGCKVSDVVDALNKINTTLDNRLTGLELDPVQLGLLIAAVQNLSNKLTTDNFISPNLNLADVLANSLYGRYIDPPNPFDGDGISDIVDEQTQLIHDMLEERMELMQLMLDQRIEVLHDRFIQTDLTLPGRFSKNITQTMEALLRRDTPFDLEILTPNIVSVLEDIFYAKPKRAEDEAKNPTTPEQETGWLADMKRFVQGQVVKLGLPKFVEDFLTTKLDTTKALSISDILLLMSSSEGVANIVNALNDLDMKTNITVNNGCGCDGDCDCNDTEPIILDDSTN